MKFLQLSNTSKYTYGHLILACCKIFTEILLLEKQVYVLFHCVRSQSSS